MKQNESLEVAAQVLDEWGSAIRGDWSNANIDGRSAKLQLAQISRQIRGEVEHDIESLRAIVGVCTGGGGHWPAYCDESCGGDL